MVPFWYHGEASPSPWAQPSASRPAGARQARRGPWLAPGGVPVNRECKGTFPGTAAVCGDRHVLGKRKRPPNRFDGRCGDMHSASTQRPGQPTRPSEIVRTPAAGPTGSGPAGQPPRRPTVPRPRRGAARNAARSAPRWQGAGSIRWRASRHGRSGFFRGRAS